jgi:AcrR family transcriptional regulator
MNKSVGRGTRGRPRGQSGRSDARERILDAARARFLADGYQAVTMRSIAAAADVDVALVSYYFQSKQGVFGAAMALPVNPLDAIDGVLTSPDEQLATGLLGTLLRVWDDPAP